MKRIRIGNIEMKKREDYWEIVQWYQNPYYGREQEFEKVEGGYKPIDSKNCFIDETCFVNPEICCVIASIEENDGEFSIRPVGFRPWELEEEDMKDLKKVINMIELYI